MKKKISALMTVFMMMFSFVDYNDKVRAEEYEKNIILTCESKEIDINDIPEDRTVDLLVSIENNPGFIVLGMTFDYDRRMDYPNWIYCRFLEDEYGNNDRVSPTMFMKFDETGDLYTQVEIPRNGDLYYDDGPMMKLLFRIPDDVQVGDEYHINFVREDEWNSRLFFVPNEYDKYDDEYFSVLNNGVIRIVGEDISSNTPEPENNNEQTSNDFAENNNITEETKNDVNTEKKSETTTVPETVKTSVSETSKTEISTTPVSSTSTAVSVETTSATESVFVTSTVTSVSDTSAVTTNETEENNDSKRNILPVILASASVIAAGLIVFLIKRRKK